MALPATFERAALAAAGFEGFLAWTVLRDGGYADVPGRPGVYVVLRPRDEPPDWVHPGSGGHFKGRDPSVPLARLQAEWVDGAQVLYIGKADVGSAGTGLQRRLREFGRFGAGEPVGHWGGRLIWQLADAQELLVAWQPISWRESPAAYEERLLAHFAALHNGRRPFANLTGGAGGQSQAAPAERSSARAAGALATGEVRTLYRWQADSIRGSLAVRARALAEGRTGFADNDLRRSLGRYERPGASPRISELTTVDQFDVLVQSGQVLIRPDDEDPELAPIAAWLRSGGRDQVLDILRRGEPGSWPPHVEAAYRYFGDFHFCVLLRASHDRPLAGEDPIKGRIDLTEQDLVHIGDALWCFAATAGPSERAHWHIRINGGQVVLYIELAQPL